MEIISTKYRIACCFICLIAFDGTAQPEIRTATALITASAGYQLAMQNNLHLYRGREYVGYRTRLVGNAFLAGGHSLPGHIRFDGVDYDSVKMGYDLVRDEVVITNLNGQLLTPQQDKVAAFSVVNRSFHRLEVKERGLAGLPDHGFYELLYQDNDTKLLVKRRSVLAENHDQQYLQFSVIRSDSYYLFKKGNVFPLTGKSSIYRAYPAIRWEVIRFSRQHQLDFRRDFEQALIRTVAFCEDNQ